MTSATRFGTASTTKLITGLAAARLVDRRRVSYDARVLELLDAASGPRDLDAAVTLGHLLSHTSGIGDYADDLDGPPYETIWEATPPGTIRRTSCRCSGTSRLEPHRATRSATTTAPLSSPASPSRR